MTSGAGLVAASLVSRFSPRAYGFQSRGQTTQVFDVLKYGAVGDGKSLDTAAIQRAIDLASASDTKSQILLRGKHTFLVGTLELKGAIDFHVAENAKVLVSTRREDYRGGLADSHSGDAMANAEGGVIVANGAQGLTISGAGTFHGRAKEFMSRYDDAGGIWVPGAFRPKMFVLTACKDLTVRDITFAEAPNWGLHMLGCDGVLVDRVTVRNLLDVPNCDGIDPDHCRDVEITGCDLVCGDDGIVVKCSRQTKEYGPCAKIRVSDCTITTQDAGLKIGTETAADVYDVRFERCTIKNSSRGLCIQLRDEGSVYNIAFRDITFNSHFFADPWWGRGEAISFTAFPRKPETTPGKLHHVTVTNVTGTAENSVRVAGTSVSRVHDITFDRVAVTLNRATSFPGGLFDNRPTTAITAIEPHDTPGFAIEHAENVKLRHCKVTWGPNVPESFTYAVEAKDAPGLKLENLNGTAARASVGKAVSIT
ncbi:MAG: hypothetical protein NVSMB62_05610 [Acidobacteriaceae bacterium]